jgi:hypothetical protein
MPAPCSSLLLPTYTALSLPPETLQDEKRHTSPSSGRVLLRLELGIAGQRRQFGHRIAHRSLSSSPTLSTLCTPIKGVIKATHVNPLVKWMGIDPLISCLPACVVDVVLITTTLHTTEFPHRDLTFLDHRPMPKTWRAEFQRDRPSQATS